MLVFAFDGFDQADLDMFATTFNLPKFTPELMGGMASQRSGEATMDLEAIHAVGPDAKTVLVNARPTVGRRGHLREDRDDDGRGRPPLPLARCGASPSDGAARRIATAADLVPALALAAAQRKGTTAFDASGDLAGLECKGGHNWSEPPGPDDVGLDSVASLPEMTDVGGTTLSTDAEGHWLAEQSWFGPALSHGTGGGVSNLFERPPWQAALNLAAPPGKKRSSPRTSPWSPIRPPVSGSSSGGRLVVGGGTSVSAPIWAGLTAVMDRVPRRTTAGGRSAT